jgi:hypothetical protein
VKGKKGGRFAARNGKFPTDEFALPPRELTGKRFLAIIRTENEILRKEKE